METVPCTLCGAKTHMTGTRLCDRCWELRKRIEADPELAQKILNETRRSKPAMYWRMGERILRTESGQKIEGYNIEKRDFGIIGQWVDQAGMGDDFIDKIINGLNGI